MSAFGDKVKKLRINKNMTQKELAKLVGVSTRSLINYETGRCYPRQAKVVAQLSDHLGVSADYLLNETPSSMPSTARQDVDILVKELAALFAGGKLSEEDRDAAMQALQQAYWDSRKVDQLSD